MELHETFFHLGFYASHNNLEFPLTKGTSLFNFNYIHHLLSLDSDQFHYGTWRLYTLGGPASQPLSGYYKASKISGVSGLKGYWA